MWKKKYGQKWRSKRKKEKKLVDKAEKQYYDFEKFLKAEQELAMARMKFAEKRMRWTAHFLLMNLWIPGFKIYFISQSALK